MQELGSPAEFSGSYARRRQTIDVAGERAADAVWRRERIAGMVRQEILPRLGRLRRQATLTEARDSLKPANPRALAAMLVAGRTQEAHAAIASRLVSGATPIEIMLEDLAPAARRLGQLWLRDACDFVDVTLATQALRDLLRDLSREGCFGELELHDPRAPSIVVMLAPGETHLLGADMVERLFRLAGWRSRRGDSENVIAELKRDWWDVAGFSLSCDRYVEPLRRAICVARTASRNPRMKILVGGPIFAGQSGLAQSLGADACASDLNVAVQLPHTLLEAVRL